MESRPRALSSVMRGLECTLAALSLPLACYLVTRILYREGDVRLYVVWLALGLHVVGQALCLSVPREATGRGLLGVSLALTAAGMLISPGGLFLHTLLPDYTLHFGDLPVAIALPGSVVLGGLCQTAALLPYLLFLKRLAYFLNKPELAKRANMILFVWVLGLASACLAAGPRLGARGGELALLGLVGAVIAAFLGGVVMVQLVFRLRLAVAERILQQTPGAQP